MAAKIQTFVRTVRDLSDDDARFTRVEDPHHLLDFPEWKLKTYQSNPYLSDLDTPCQLIGVQDGKIVGRRNSYPGRIVADGKVYDMRISGSVFVDPKSRSGLYALSLLQQALKFPNGDLNINCGLSPQNEKFYRLLGSAMFGLNIYEAGGRFAKSYKGVQRVWWKKIAARIINVFFAALNAISDRGRWRALPQWRVEEVELSNAELVRRYCELVREDTHRYRQEITPEWIQWSLKNDFITPLAEKNIIAVYNKDELVGMALTRTDNQQRGAKIFDWQMDSNYRNREAEFLALIAKYLCLFTYRVKVIVRVDDDGLNIALSRRFPLLYTNTAVVTLAEDSRFSEFEGIREACNWRVSPGMGDAPFW